MGVHGKPVRIEKMPFVCQPFEQRAGNPCQALAEGNLVDEVDHGVVRQVERRAAARTGAIERNLAHGAFVAAVFAVAVGFAVGVGNAEGEPFRVAPLELRLEAVIVLVGIGVEGEDAAQSLDALFRRATDRRTAGAAGGFGSSYRATAARR